MSCSKLSKFIAQPIVCTEFRPKKVIILTSSKGFYLKRNLDLVEPFNIDLEIICKAGAQLPDFLSWLTSNLAKKVKLHGCIELYIWLGTCDLTVKKGPYVSLRHSTNELANEYLTCYINQYLDFVENFQTVKLVFAEIPPYSIVEWNRVKGHPNSQEFLEQDLVLDERLQSLNEYFHAVNRRLGVKSPCFRVDVLRYWKSKSQSKARVSVNFGLYKDGIHPGTLLARCWLKKFLLCILGV